jgi:hypothetical protein
MQDNKPNQAEIALTLSHSLTGSCDRCQTASALLVRHMKIDFFAQKSVQISDFQTQNANSKSQINFPLSL